MKHKIPDEAMPAIYLTRDEELWVERETDAMVHDTVLSFEEFIANNRKFPADKWKHIKSKGGCSVFRTRKSHNSAAARSQRPSHVSTWSRSDPSTSSQSSGSTVSRSHDDSIPTKRKEPAMTPTRDFPIIVLSGVIPGTMEDAGYGALAANEAIWRLRSTYISDEQRDSKILATIEHPSAADPFRFLGIKWAWRKLPGWVQQRDLVYAESSGVYEGVEACASPGNNTITGYTLMHSIELPGIPELSEYGLLRMKLSLCYLIRQFDDTSVEWYCRAFSIPVGKIPTSIGAMIYAEGLLATVNTMECSYTKKLMWLTQQRRKRSIQYTKQGLDTATHCQGCLRGLKLFGGLARSASTCSCCKRIVCTRCSSEKKMVLDVADDGEVTQKSLPFCLQCVAEAKALPALDIALATVATWHDQ